MRRGRLRFLLVFKVKGSLTQSGSGAIKPTWTEFGRRMGEISDLTGREREIAAQERSDQDTRITIGNLPGLTTDMRAECQATGIVYDIKAIQRDKTFRWEMTLYCKTGVNQE